MDTQKLHDLIDKVIGKKGPLRVPSYWMGRVIKSIVKYSEASHKTALSEINKLRANVNTVISTVIKTPLQFTYQELAELALAAKLVPGQQYILKDYEFTTSSQFEECAGFAHSSMTTNQPIILLTAQSTKTFSSEAKYITDIYKYGRSQEWDIIFFFFGNKNYAWNRHVDEVPSFTATDPEGNSFVFTLSIVQSRKVYYTDNEGRLWSSDSSREGIGDNDIPVKYLNVGSEIILETPGQVQVCFSVTSVSKPFKGLIAKAYSSGRDVELPYDPYLSQPNFDLYLPDDSSITCHGGQLNPYITRFTLKPLKKEGLIYPPRISIAYSGDFACYIGPNCDKIYIYSLDDGPFYIEGNCQDICIYYKDNGSIRIDGACARLSIRVDSLYLTALGKCTNIEFIHSAAFVVLYNNKYLRTSPVNGRTTFIGLDSKGTIRQWNPADFIDAVEVEEQTIETVEE